MSSQWATVCVSYGEGKKHLCVEDSMSFDFHSTEQEAREELHTKIEQGGRMVALLHVEGVYRPSKIEIERI
jgi:hypothetical protein